MSLESLFVRCQANWLLRSATQPRYPSPCLKPGACRDLGQSLTVFELEGHQEFVRQGLYERRMAK